MQFIKWLGQQGGHTMSKDISTLAQEAIDRILAGQRTGSTLLKWKQERYNKLTSNAKTSADITAKLAAMVEEDEAWEHRNPPTGHSIENAMVDGVMQDNRRLNALTKELSHQVSLLQSAGASLTNIIALLKRALL